jgi:hypothetical protein
MSSLTLGSKKMPRLKVNFTSILSSNQNSYFDKSFQSEIGIRFRDNTHYPLYFIVSVLVVMVSDCKKKLTR